MKRLIQRISAVVLSAVLLTGAVSVPAQAANVSNFQDVSQTDYYAQAVDWAVEHGVTAGTSDTQFSPAATITRAQAMTFLWRAAGSPEPSTAVSPFSDVASKDLYYYKPVLWAVENGITAGVSQTEFGPQVTLAYDQIFLFLCRAAGDAPQGNDWSAAAVAWAKENDLTDALTFTAKGACPRSDVVYCLWRQFEGDDTEKPEETQQTQKPEEEQKPTDPEKPTLTNEAGATLTITTGFLDRKSAIDISDFGLEASQAEQLALEIADIDGANPYGVTHLNAYEQDGQIAKTLAVYYTTSTISITTTANHDWRYISNAALAEADRVVDQVVTAGMSDYDIVKSLHDYLVTHCDYDSRVYTNNMPFVSHQAEGALLKGTAVCSGYAKAYEILLDAAGIPSETITGYASGYHAWNLVQVDGQWYHVDATWDDPTNRGGDYIRYTYFLKSDKLMLSRSHRDWQAVYSCTSTKYDEDLLDSVDQALADTREQDVNAILAACTSALQALPQWTTEELQSLSDEQLTDALYFTIDLSNSGYDSNQLSKYRNEVTDAISAQYPNLTHGSFDSRAMCFEFRVAAVQAEQQRRQEAAQAEREQQKAQDEAASKEVEQLLQDAIINNDSYGSRVVVLEGYTVEAVELACKTMRTKGYSFDGYVFSTDFLVTQKWNTNEVTVTNYKWMHAETQRYIDQIEKAILQGETEIVLQPGEYPDKQPWYYASDASRRVAAQGYTVGGMTSGVDYVISRTAIRSATNECMVWVEYPAQEIPDDTGSQAESTTEQTSTEQEAHTTDPDVQTSETAA